MWPLLFCSILVLFVVLERFIFWLMVDLQRDQNLLDEVLELCRRGRWDQVREKVRGSRDYIIRILVTGIVHREYSMSKAMESAATEQLQKMGRYMGILDTMITVAPLLGILGTVIGIIDSFEILGASGIDDPRAVTGGIAQALITTATGLAIAIFSVFPFNYFRSRLRRAAHGIEQYATSLEIVYGKLGQESTRPETEQ
jgi:biopolymer transport protein ExbB